MKRILEHFARGTALIAVLSLGLFLVAASILKGVGWSLPDLLKQISISVPSSRPTAKADEVQNYVLFTEVKFGDGQIITGIKYTSTLRQQINSQWCYISENTKAGEPTTRLQLATVSQSGTQTIAPFTEAALSQFGLTAQTATSIVKSHCRFQ
uniref:hypothetical protein n=1 Tax=Pararhizobium sp. IMCC3301 TaxID=3067904 RepID=UPI0027420CE1|nr:hypothetical protein [Pararhizobium sp. IMCC3301]